MTQRYTAAVAHERMASGTCPECGLPPEQHSGEVRFWLRPQGCDLLPRGVAERIEQYRTDRHGTSRLIEEP